jgi:arylsulfatase A-like enzyme
MLHVIRRLDEAIGLMVTALKSQGLFVNTMIIVTPKHGARDSTITSI